MCGIAGAIDPGGREGDEWVAAVNRAQAHRGPDDAVAVRRGAFVLGNTRLAILDTSTAGNQPFEDPAHRYVVVLNGEIYNYLELIDEYRLEVPSGCDGAVIPLLWSRFGLATLELLRGMYAIAVLDSVEQRLVLARDPFGIKPLYWRPMPGGRMAFASDRALARLVSRPSVSLARWPATCISGRSVPTSPPSRGSSPCLPTRRRPSPAWRGLRQ